MIDKGIRNRTRGCDKASLEVLAAFAGITFAWYRDIEAGSDDLTELSVIQTIRLMAAFGIRRFVDLLDHEMPAEDHRKELEERGYTLDTDKDLAKPRLEVSSDATGLLLANSIRKLLPEDLTPIEDDLGWAAEAVETGLQDDEKMAQIAIPMLMDICRYVNVSFIDVMDRYFALLVAATQT